MISVREINTPRAIQDPLWTLFILYSINIFLSIHSMTKRAILMRETLGDIIEIDLNIEPRKNEIFKIIGGPPTFIGQWPELDVVIMKSQCGEIINKNKLPTPFDTEKVNGAILLVRMDEESEHQDFTLAEYLRFTSGNKSIST